ncbi:MAG: hypothetical protein HZC48_00760 [Nitrospirae bacterium]|nr:hypothetical protein [Nitrospirota bacterium]
MAIHESTAKETLEYKTDPVVLAQACQDVLKKLGKVTDVSRETGTIAGKINVGLLTDAAQVILRIAHKGDYTELSVQTSRGEGLLTDSGAQKALSLFLSAMDKDKRLTGKASGGW